MDRIELLNIIFTLNQTGKGVEVGTFKGEFSKEILQRWQGKLYMVDVWRELGEEYIDSSNHKNFDGGVYGDCMNNIKGFEDKGIMVRSTSKVASDMFTDNSLDFVYIDANHAYDYVRQDIELWYPKVKSGGWVMGHDYIKLDWLEPPFTENGKDKHIWVNDGNGGPYNIYAGIFGVNPAVDEFCKEYNYQPNFTSEFFATWYFRKK
jgi:hypothetical protein